MRESNTAPAASLGELALPEWKQDTVSVLKRRLRDAIGDVLASCPDVEAAESDEAVAELLEGNFYAARAAFERLSGHVPRELFQTIGMRCIEKHLITYGCAAYRVIGETPPRRLLLASGDASFKVNDLERAEDAYLVAHSRRRLTRVADRLLASGYFYAARAIFERAGLRIPRKRFLRAAEQLRAVGDEHKASGARPALGIHVNRD
jgi:hypothetical protein